MILRLCILLIAILIAIPASANEFNPDFRGGIDTTIFVISTGGLWEQGTRYGNWRVIVINRGWEHRRSFLYLQWLKTDDDKKKVTELETVPIPEFNAGDWRNVLNVEYQNNVFIIYYSLRGRTAIRRAILEPELPGKYSIRFEQNVMSSHKLIGN